MRKTTLWSLTALSVGFAVLAVGTIVGISLWSAQPSASASAQQPDGFYTFPPRVFVPGPPSARRVRSGWRTDDRAKIRAPIKAIQCGQLLDVRERRVRRNVTILTNGERIVEVRNGIVRPMDADAVIDLHDQVCAPGLMDMHVHLTAANIRVGETDRAQNHFDYTVTETAIGLENARETLYSGVTTIRAPGEHLPGTGFVYLREAIDKWEALGPRIFLATNAMGRDAARAVVRQSQLTPGARYEGRRRHSNVDYEPTKSGDDVRQAVRNQLALGEEWIKVSVDIGGDLTEGMQHVQLFTFEELQAMADEAHKWGAKITGHIETDSVTRQCVLAGFDSVEHSYILSKETADLMKERNVYWSTTLTDLTPAFDPTDPRIGADELSGLDKDHVERMRRRDEGFRYAYSIGVPIVYASDGAFEPGTNRGHMVLEFSQYLALGVTPWDLLTFATLNPAAMLGESDNLGSIDPGKFADIIALPRNPLEDVTAYNDVSFVMKGGNVVRDDLHRSPLPDVFAMQLPDVTYVVRDPKAPFTAENLTCTGRDC